jgi:MSHA biogenesis protein MshK
MQTTNRILTWIGMVLAAALVLVSGLKAGELADPTRPAAFRASSAVVSNSAPARLRVEAILDRGGQRLAIVDGKVVRAGDRIGNARIDEVMSDGVRYTRAGTSQVSRLENTKLQVRRESPVQVAQKETP